jgi:hypothetical protein
MLPTLAPLRTLLSLLLFCTVASPLSAQESFLSFDYPYVEVQKMIYKMKAVDILFEQANTQLCVRYNGAVTTFYFEQGVLYNVDETRTFEKQKDAETAFQTSVQYLLDLHVMPVEFAADHVIATLGDKVYRLILRPNEMNTLDVVLSCKNVRLTPMSKLEGIDFTAFGEKSDD